MQQAPAPAKQAPQAAEEKREQAKASGQPCEKPPGKPETSSKQNVKPAAKPEQKSGQPVKKTGEEAPKKNTGNIFYNEETIGHFLIGSSKVLIIITRIIFILCAALCAGVLLAVAANYHAYSGGTPNSEAIIAASASGVIVFILLAFFTPLFYSLFYALGVLVNDTKEIRGALGKEGETDSSDG